jgi:hypothetical protein
MIHHVLRSAHRSLCSKGELSGPFWIVCWWISSGALVCRSSQRGISIGPGSFCTRCCGQRCLSILCSVWSLLPSEWALAAATAIIARICLMSARTSTLLQWMHSSRHGRREKASVLLCFRPSLCSEMKLSLEVLKTHGPG